MCDFNCSVDCVESIVLVFIVEGENGPELNVLNSIERKREKN